MSKPGQRAGRGRKTFDWAEFLRRHGELQAAVDGGGAPDAEAREATLKARARALARRPPDASAEAAALEIIEFVLADERYGVDTAFVGGVFPLTELARVPCTPPFVRGVVNVRGEIVSVVDLKQFFELPAQGLSDLNRVILLASEQMSFGILADRVEGVRSVDAALQPVLPTFTDRRGDYSKGIAGGTVVILDAAALLADPRMVVDEVVQD